jgi:hypothetical protein
VSPEPEIVVPAGPSLEEAAAWSGHACWCELRLHEVLTAWLAVEVDPVAAAALWSQRADAAERAEAWHRRLPELREWPRDRFVAPSSDAVARLFAGLESLDQPEATAARRGALAAVLRGLRVGYHRRQAVAVGPADGPTATTLQAALRGTFDTAGAEPDPAWTDAVEEAGGLP